MTGDLVLKTFLFFISSISGGARMMMMMMIAPLSGLNVVQAAFSSL
jgi:hypothetical protein